MSTFGRNRQSVADIEQELYDIFNNHPDSREDQSGQPEIPAGALVDVLRAFSEVYNGADLLNDEEMARLKELLANNPGLAVTPQILLQFIAEKTKHSPRESPHGSPVEEDVTLTDDRRRNSLSRSRSSSRGSGGTSRVYSRPPSVPPQTPTAATGSAFDTSRRQRTTPLDVQPPSSWSKRPAPASRRKSVDGGSNCALSDSESSFSSSPSSFGKPSRRTRAPSNPTSPSSMSSGMFSPTSIGSPPFVRPNSRAQSQPFTSIGIHYSSPDRDHNSSGEHSPDFDSSFEYQQGGDNFASRISSLPMPSSASDSDSDGENESMLGLVLDRSAASSTVSLEPLDRLDALQKANTDLGRKLMEAEKTLQNKLMEHDMDLDEMESRLEELKSELTSTKREEKELRSKERTNSTQIAALESEIAKLQKSLENARSSYQSLQKQYQEQCTESERYRNQLRRRDQEIKDCQDAAVLHSLEGIKWAKEASSYEDRLAHLEEELSIAQQAHAQLDEQKQENLMLKETIDRMRFDMDEMRNAATNAAAASGPSSAANTVSKSLGAELMGQMGGSWEHEDDGVETEGDSGELDLDEDEDTEDEEEDVIQTIITRKKRKVARANKLETVTFSETKEYSDASTQHYAAEYTSVHATQTDPEPKIFISSFSVQTEEVRRGTSAVQTDLEAKPASPTTLSIEVQTDEPEPEVSRSVSPQATPEDDEALASSSSTVIPPTPRGHPEPHPSDEPPSYNFVTELEQSSIINNTLMDQHKGITLPIRGIPGGISEDAVDEWKALKEELGVECEIIDELIARSTVKRQPRRQNRFYKIYNTYVIGKGGNEEGEEGDAWLAGTARQALISAGAMTLVFLCMASRMPAIGAQYSPVGGPTVYDRAAWSSFNSMQGAGEGFGYDGTAALWNIMGRVGFGAARIAGGWPT
ncbi:hypothetical protein K503DRAFT_869881 [Rhizopogon vinicolor AM-OR11-026]|uniref:Uncharacterized protein n=1 Tax=Rhizopogon vinicolor AM-OR11-026 TaxID=1314800 RepID=A0A1B7MJZ9_9AGAM|nr:hypothetical protein K503DRAFT_869881 [Rhizopogon vinicolor AM-OR11-026]